MSKELKVDRIKCLLSTKQSYPKTIKKKIDKDGHRADKIEKFLKKKLLKHKDCTVYIDGHDYWIYSSVRGVTFVMKDIVFKTTVDANGAQEDIDYLVSVINKAEMIVGQVIPIWKQQLAIGTIMDDQKASAEIEQKMADATNQMILKNAHNLQRNSVMLAQANEDAIFRVETLKDTTHTLIQTIKDVQSIHANGEEKRNEILREMKTLGEELADVIRNTKVN